VDLCFLLFDYGAAGLLVGEHCLVACLNQRILNSRHLADLGAIFCALTLAIGLVRFLGGRLWRRRSGPVEINADSTCRKSPMKRMYSYWQLWHFALSFRP